LAQLFLGGTHFGEQQDWIAHRLKRAKPHLVRLGNTGMGHDAGTRRLRIVIALDDPCAEPGLRLELERWL
jgi:hypothetical protein